MTRAVAFALGLLAVCTLGCGGISTPSQNQTQTSNGTLTVGSQVGFPFSVGKTGEFTVKLTAWGPNSNIFVGMAWVVGNSDGSCSASVLQQNNFVLLNTQALGGAIVSGKYCIIIYDVGTLTAAQTYTFTVSHP